MSRGFVKEDDLAENIVVPERRISEHPNYVTPRGLNLLEGRVAKLIEERSKLQDRDEADTRERLGRVERDLRYYATRLESAKLVPALIQAPPQVTFGCRVTVAMPDGEENTYTLVGEDEADIEYGLVSWVSPLGKALLGAREGDQVLWRRPAGDVSLEVVEIGAPGSNA